MARARPTKDHITFVLVVGMEDPGRHVDNDTNAHAWSRLKAPAIIKQ